MGISLKVTIYLMTASVSFLNVTGNKERPAVSCVNTPVNQMVNHGGSVTINCTYPIAEESIIIKSFCREDENFNCTNLISAYKANHTKRDRFSLTDHKQQGVYTVTISTVTQDDAGRYQCAMERLNNRSIACLTEINLLVWKSGSYDDNCPYADISKESKEPSVSNIPGRYIKAKTSVSSRPSVQNNEPPENDIPPNNGMIGGVVGGLVLLVIGLLVAVLLLVRHKLPSTQGCCAGGESSERGTNAGHNTEGNPQDHNYEEIQIQNQQANWGHTPQSVYATVNPPANQLHYACINLQKDSVTVSTDGNVLPDTNKNGSSAGDYSAVNRTQGAAHPPAAEQSVYSAVTKPGEPRERQSFT